MPTVEMNRMRDATSPGHPTAALRASSKWLCDSFCCCCWRICITSVSSWDNHYLLLLLPLSSCSCSFVILTAALSPSSEAASSIVTHANQSIVRNNCPAFSFEKPTGRNINTWSVVDAQQDAFAQSDALQGGYYLLWFETLLVSVCTDDRW